MAGTQPSGVDNTFRRKFDKEKYLERARQRERDEKDEAHRGKDRGPPVQRQPLKHRDYEVDLESRLGKTQVVTPIAPLSQQALSGSSYKKQRGNSHVWSRREDTT